MNLFFKTTFLVITTIISIHLFIKLLLFFSTMARLQTYSKELDATSLNPSKLNVNIKDIPFLYEYPYYGRHCIVDSRSLPFAFFRKINKSVALVIFVDGSKKIYLRENVPLIIIEDYQNHDFDDFKTAIHDIPDLESGIFRFCLESSFF